MPTRHCRRLLGPASQSMPWRLYRAHYERPSNYCRMLMGRKNGRELRLRRQDACFYRAVVFNNRSSKALLTKPATRCHFSPCRIMRVILSAPKMRCPPKSMTKREVMLADAAASRRWAQKHGRNSRLDFTGRHRQASRLSFSRSMGGHQRSTASGRFLGQPF